MDTRKIKLFIRDKYCALVGKTPLVNQYNNIVCSIDYHLEKINYYEAGYRLLIEESGELKEERFVMDKKGVVFMVKMNPYAASNAKLRKKIRLGIDIMKRYGITQHQSNEH